MMPDFIDLYRDRIFACEIIAIVGLVCFFIGESTGYTRAKRHRRRFIKNVQKFVDNSEKVRKRHARNS